MGVSARTTIGMTATASTVGLLIGEEGEMRVTKEAVITLVLLAVSGLLGWFIGRTVAVVREY